MARSILDGWEDVPFFELGTSYRLTQTDVAFLSVHNPSEDRTRAEGDDYYLAQLWLGNYVALVLLPTPIDLLPFLNQVSPIIQANMVSLERANALQARENVENLRRNLRFRG
jgi:hypothetical protein